MRDPDGSISTLLRHIYPHISFQTYVDFVEHWSSYSITRCQ